MTPTSFVDTGGFVHAFIRKLEIRKLEAGRARAARAPSQAFAGVLQRRSPDVAALVVLAAIVVALVATGHHVPAEVARGFASAQASDAADVEPMPARTPP
ncbi:MAG TPA: hypothetical protein VIW03_12785 [Anaeromyxobacter sp.]